jgi:hypothetical protein
MQLLTVLQAQTVRTTRPIRGGYGPLPDAIKAVADRYHFIGKPADTDIVAATSVATNPNIPAKPLIFLQGQTTVRHRVIAIERLEIYAAGFLVATRTNTSDTDLIADDVIVWASSHFDITYEDLRAGRGHMSQIDFRFERPLPELFPQFARIRNRMSSELAEFFEFSAPYELTALQFWFDKNKFPTFAPPLLRIDRRDGVPFEQNVYWSDAPLTTDGHIAVLSDFEQACLEALR